MRTIYIPWFYIDSQPKVKVKFVPSVYIRVITIFFFFLTLPLVFLEGCLITLIRLPNVSLETQRNHVKTSRQILGRPSIKILFRTHFEVSPVGLQI